MMVHLLARIGPESALIAHCLEQAAWHQTRALAYTREAREARPQPLAATEQHALVLRALKHLVQAQQLVRQAQQASRSPAQAQILAEPRTRLQAVVDSIEQEAARAYAALATRVSAPKPAQEQLL